MISSTDGAAAFFFAGFTAAGAGSVATAGLAFDFFLVELTLVRGMAGRRRATTTSTCHGVARAAL